MRQKLNHIDKQEVLHYLQYRGDDPQILEDIDLAMEVLIKTATPRIVYKQYRLNNAQLQDCLVHLEGKDIAALLATSSHCILIAATLGSKIDVLLKKIQLIDMGKALLYDACANAAIEQVLDDVQANIVNELAKEKRYCSDRFSCGYGDLPLHLQADFLKELDTQKSIGLYCNDAYVLFPNKSVTALIGVSKQLQPSLVKGCDGCMLYAQCARRKAGNPCVKT